MHMHMHIHIHIHIQIQIHIHTQHIHIHIHIQIHIQIQIQIQIQIHTHIHIHTYTQNIRYIPHQPCKHGQFLHYYRAILPQSHITTTPHYCMIHTYRIRLADKASSDGPHCINKTQKKHLVPPCSQLL